VELGVTILSQHLVLAYEPGNVRMVHVWGGHEVSVAADSLALVTMRYSDSGLYDALDEDLDALTTAGISQLHLIGDAHSPGKSPRPSSPATASHRRSTR
jgi:dimethylamine/trimethylamine dehydrogenase